MSEHTAWNRGFDAGWYAALEQKGKTIPNPYPVSPERDGKIARLSCRECLGGQHEACRDQRKCPCARADHPETPDAEIEAAVLDLRRATTEMEQARVALREFMDTWGRR